MRDNDFTIVSCSISKEPYIRKYGRLQDVCGLSLSFIVQRTVFFLDGLIKKYFHIKRVTGKEPFSNRGHPSPIFQPINGMIFGCKGTHIIRVLG
jgi:hypothetical protein